MTQKPTYEELLQKIERLEKEIDTRNLSGSDTQWMKSQRQHIQKMESIETFSGGIANDFNNILMGIQGRISLMLLDIDSSHTYFEHLKEIEDCVAKAEDLTDKLLRFSKTGEYKATPVDLNDVIKRCADAFVDEQTEIRIHTKHAKSIWTVEADKEQIEQAITSFLIHAEQSMPEGGDLYIQIENTMLDEDHTKPFNVVPGAFVQISLTDTGMGMDQDSKQKIFDPFFTTNESESGMGFQLTSAYGIIKHHGGITNIYSEIGKGSTFTIYLPVSEKQFIKFTDFVEELSSGSETILLVDDEEMILDIGAQLLERLGYNVLAAKNGKGAIDIYKEKGDRIDMVLLDIIMPDMDGGETYDKLKEIDPEVKVLLASGHSLDGQATSILERGCNGFIQKPFGLNQLSRKIKEILKQ